MASVACLTFNPFQENTYIVYDETKECIIFDPGCWDEGEETELRLAIQNLGLTPVRLINTHCHLDHVYGNAFVAQQYALGLEIHEGELPVLMRFQDTAVKFMLPKPPPSPAPSRFIAAEELVQFGNTTLRALYTPGHSPASLSFYCAESKFVIAGDVLFQGSIGRTDLAGGDYDTLLDSIRTQLFTLPDETVVYPGHGGHTTIGEEWRTNPFFND